MEEEAPFAPYTLAFDLYGTIVSPASIGKTLALSFDGDEQEAAKVSATWRTLQLQYTWRLNSMHRYESFSTVTQRSLLHALREHGHVLPAGRITQLMAAYDELDVFPDAGPALQTLAAHAPQFDPVIFSNGTPAMLANCVRCSPGLAPYANTFRDIISVDEIKRFKPDPTAYRHLAQRVRQTGRERNVWLVSSNTWDVVGARAVGLRAVWVNRDMGTKGWYDALEDGDIGRPTIIVKSLGDVVEKILAWEAEQARA